MILSLCKLPMLFDSDGSFGHVALALATLHLFFSIPFHPLFSFWSPGAFLLSTCHPGLPFSRCTFHLQLDRQSKSSKKDPSIKIREYFVLKMVKKMYT